MKEEMSVEDINFGIEDIGSDILTRFSDDMYNAESIIRELVKNGSDSYYQLEAYCNDKRIPLPENYDPEDRKIIIDIEKEMFLKFREIYKHLFYFPSLGWENVLHILWKQRCCESR